MGTGKTLQVIALLDILFRQKQLERVIICMPKTSVLSWENNYRKWLPDVHNLINLINTTGLNDDDDDLESENEKFDNDDKLSTWKNSGGILLINYHQLFSRLNDSPDFYLNKPDLLILDEGHQIRNCKTKIFKALNDIKTSRRIILTGTPIINSLMEYKNLIDFIKPNLFGPSRLFEKSISSEIKDNTFTNNKFTDEQKIWDLTDYFVNRLDDFFLNIDMSLYFIQTGKKFEVYVHDYGIKLTELQKIMVTLYADEYCKNGFERIFQHKPLENRSLKETESHKKYNKSKMKDVAILNDITNNHDANNNYYLDDDGDEDDQGKAAKFFNDIHIFHLISTHPFALMFKKYPGQVGLMDNLLDFEFMDKFDANTKTCTNFTDYLDRCIEEGFLTIDESKEISQSNKFAILNKILNVLSKNNEKMYSF